MSGTNPFRRKTAEQSSNVPIGPVHNLFENQDRPEPRIPPIDTGQFNGSKAKKPPNSSSYIGHGLANAYQTFHALPRQRLARLFESSPRILPHPTARMVFHTDCSLLRPAFPPLRPQICYPEASKTNRQKTLSARNPKEQATTWKMSIRDRIP